MESVCCRACARIHRHHVMCPAFLSKQRFRALAENPTSVFCFSSDNHATKYNTNFYFLLEFSCNFISFSNNLLNKFSSWILNLLAERRRAFIAQGQRNRRLITMVIEILTMSWKYHIYLQSILKVWLVLIDLMKNVMNP
jgi:hypothetical protein